MAKKKNSIALFEAISKSREKNPNLGVSAPGWMGKAPQPQEPGQPSADGPPPLSGAASYGGPTVSLSGGGLVLILAVVVAVAAVAFYVGRTTAPYRTVEKAAPGFHRTAANAAEGPASTDNLDLPARVPGKQYLVIQRLAGMTAKDYRDANDIADWLVKQKGEVCEAKVIPLKNDKFLAVWSLKAFDSYLSPEAQKYAEHIEALGKEFKTTETYRKSTGKYTFSQHRQGKLDPYFVVYKGP